LSVPIELSLGEEALSRNVADVPAAEHDESEAHHRRTLSDHPCPGVRLRHIVVVNMNNRRVLVDRHEEIASALDRLGVRRGRPVLVLVGGAAGMSRGHLEFVAELLRDAVLPVLIARDVAVVDGGTTSGVMGAVGRLHDRALPLVGVVAEGVVGAADLEPHHVHLLVPGDSWGDESPWLADVADVIAGGCRSVTLLINGGEITYDDAAHSIERGRPVLVLAASGRTAAAIGAAAAGDVVGQRAAEIAGSPLTRVVTAQDLAAAIEAELTTFG